MCARKSSSVNCTRYPPHDLLSKILLVPIGMLSVQQLLKNGNSYHPPICVECTNRELHLATGRYHSIERIE